MSPLVTIDVAGGPLRLPLVVAMHLGIEPGDSVPAEMFPDIERSCKAYNTALLIIDRAHAALFPDPCAPAHFAPDPHCPECQGKGRLTHTYQPEPGKPPQASTSNCRTCIQPYPRWPRPRIGGRL